MQYEILARYGLRVRSSPEIKSGNILGVLKSGSVVSVAEKSSGSRYEWGRIDFGGLHGWIALSPNLVTEFVHGEGFRWTSWPTDHIHFPNSTRVSVTQKFGVNEANYREFNLKGHEGIDFYAPHGENIYAVASGVVFKVGHEREPRRRGGHNYGVRVYIRHAEGYESIYAHLDDIVVRVGDEVNGGDIVGHADNTGNSFGDHLHLTMKHPSGQDGWPYGIIDPTRFMIDYLRG